MTARLDGKVAVITGGAQGMGRASVLRFIAEGARVVFVDLNDAAAEETLSLAAAPDRVRFLHGDTAEESTLVEAISMATSNFGTLDCVFANAAVGGARGRLTDIRVEDWDFTMQAILRSVFVAIKHGARTLQQLGKGGSLIVTGSIGGTTVQARTAYGVAKAGVLHLVRYAANELGPSQIRVNAISPGAILTPMAGPNWQDREQELKSLQPLPVTGMPEDIANMALFLASDESRFVNGADLVVDGGGSIEPPANAMPMVQKALSMTTVGRDFGSTGIPPVYVE